MVRRLVLTAACIDVGYIALFMAGVVAARWSAWAALRCIWRPTRSSGTAKCLGAHADLVGVAAHTALGSLLIGWESGFHYYLLLFVPAIVVANAGHYAVCRLWWLLAYYLGLWALCNHLGRWNPWPARGRQIVNWIHICIAFCVVGSAGGPPGAPS